MFILFITENSLGYYFWPEKYPLKASDTCLRFNFGHTGFI